MSLDGVILINISDNLECVFFLVSCSLLGINVPRRRFLPVKTCSDLLIIMSNLYEMEHGRLTMNPLRQFPTVPIVQLSGSHFKKVRGQFIFWCRNVLLDFNSLEAIILFQTIFLLYSKQSQVM